MIQVSYDSKPTLYIIPTPIGNLKDITLRSLEMLETVNIILSEDTRVTRQLLNHYNIRNKELISCHKFNELQKASYVISLLKKGKNIALVSDRGTPLLSDPGYFLCSKVIDSGFNVVSLPGPNALLPALNVSNINADHFLFFGFLSQKENESIKQLQNLKSVKFTIVLYESPHRILKTLQKIRKILGNKQISISREISKVHEEVFRGTVEDAIKQYKNPIGEFVIVIDNNSIDNENLVKSLDDLKMLLDYDIKPTEALKYISKKYNVSKNKLYKIYEEKNL